MEKLTLLDGLVRMPERIIDLCKADGTSIVIITENKYKIGLHQVLTVKLFSEEISFRFDPKGRFDFDNKSMIVIMSPDTHTDRLKGYEINYAIVENKATCTPEFIEVLKQRLI